MARTTEEILEDILRVQEETHSKIEDSVEYTRETSRLSTRFLDEVSNILGMQANVQQPFAFMSVLLDNIQKQKEIFNQFQKTSLSFGSSVALLKSNTQIEKNIRQFGPQVALTAATDALATGTLDLSKQTFDLSVEMKAAGENSRQLLSLQKSLINQGGLSVSQMDDLAIQLKSSRDSYGISTEYLVESINLLADKFGEYNLMGNTAEVTQTLVDLTNMYGAENAQLLSDVIKTVTTGNRLSSFSMLGVAQQARGVQETPSAGGMMSLIQQMADGAQSFYQQQETALGPAMAAERTKQMFGPEILRVVQLANAPKMEGPRLTEQDVTQALKSQEDIQRDIATNSQVLNGQIAVMLAKMDHQFYLLGTQIFILGNSLVTLQRMVTAIRSFEAQALGKDPPDRTFFDKLFAGNAAATAKVASPLAKVSGGIFALAGVGMSIKELSNSFDASQDTQIDYMDTTVGLLTTLVGLAGIFPSIGTFMAQLFPLMGGMMTFLLANPIGLAVAALAATVAAIYYLADDTDKDKPQKVVVQQPKEGGVITTNSFLSANTELTRAILSNALTSKRSDDLMLTELKKANDYTKQLIDVNQKMLRSRGITVTTPGVPFSTP